MVNRNGLMKRRWEQASYTVEAAFVVPLGFLVLMSLRQYVMTSTL